MNRQHVVAKGLGIERGFRWRGHEVTRIEGFSDAVFAFAVTLLVVSLEVPKTFSELLEAMSGFIAFALCFSWLIWIWYSHYVFFRRYGLQDRYTIVLNAALLFVILFYVYPLKFLATLLVSQLIMGNATVRRPNGIVENMIGQGQGSTLMIIYDLGFIAVFIVFILLYWHAYHRRDSLGLNALETLDTRAHIWANLSMVCVGTTSLLIVIIGGEAKLSLAGLMYFAIGPIRTVFGFLYGKRRRKVEEGVVDEAG
ncbi:MAG: DUF1211 domain-containing protein [Ignavibacteria bacterium]|nr:DUF1211 domain-containing protein [Ignavibacteria bacterium]MBI3765697.1 DUF1211 domain-containing protein [Ignavibacteriales bacterium]